MCIIVDANAAGDVARGTDGGRPVREWLLRGRSAGLIVGGRLLKELSEGGLRDTLRVLDQAGRLRRIAAAQVERIEASLTSDRQCVSNDRHVVALVIASNCNLVFTKDKNLHKDLKNPRVLRSRPRIYQEARHANLLAPCKCTSMED